MKIENPQEIIDNMVAAIENMIDAKLLVNAGNEYHYHGVYQARADIRESLALLNVEIN